MNSLPSIGYCTNVHAGTSLEEVRSNLARYSAPVRQTLAPDGDLNVGLWLAHDTAVELIDTNGIPAFRDWLIEQRLHPYTLNGFPFGNFHQEVVKHEVYRPTWADRARLEYTQQLATIQSILLADKSHGTISTLPLGWPDPKLDESFTDACARHLIELACFLADLKDRSGKSIRVCIEPEPGCIFDTAGDLTEFFARQLMNSPHEERVREHLGVCHDICHSAVMFESQQSAVEAYLQAGIVVGKVQVSSAVEADFEGLEEADARQRLDRLSEFCEPRYLHQTTIQSRDGVRFYEDLPLALKVEGDQPKGKWRVHFHVPVFQDTYDGVGSTQSAIPELLGVLHRHQLQPQLEIETYAWHVLPDRYQDESLVDSLVREIQWLDQQLQRIH